MISTDKTFFDSDCFSSFLWANAEHIMLKLFKGRIVLPQAVVDEISRVNHLYSKLEQYINNGDVKVQDICVQDEAFKYYQKFTVSPEKGYKVIGEGEAAVLALAKAEDGIAASNNLRDIKRYIDDLGIKHITTAVILEEAMKNKHITEKEGNRIWKKMIEKKRKLPYETFTDYLNSKKTS